MAGRKRDHGKWLILHFSIFKRTKQVLLFEHKALHPHFSSGSKLYSWLLWTPHTRDPDQPVGLAMPSHFLTKWQQTKHQHSGWHLADPSNGNSTQALSSWTAANHSMSCLNTLGSRVTEWVFFWRQLKPEAIYQLSDLSHCVAGRHISSKLTLHSSSSCLDCGQWWSRRRADRRDKQSLYPNC